MYKYFELRIKFYIVLKVYKNILFYLVVEIDRSDVLFVFVFRYKFFIEVFFIE